MANIMTIIRIVLALLLLFIPSFSISFRVLYLLAGMTDMLDGWMARKTGTVSAAGARLDTVADITQNVVGLLQNYTATTMLANSEFVALLKQANTDSAKMAEVIGVSEAQLRFVTNSSSGMGLIKCGPAVIPFDNQ